MTSAVSTAIQQGRRMSHLSKEEAAHQLGIDPRTLSRYETTTARDAVKNPDEGLIANMIRLYNDPLIGLLYLMANPIVIEICNRFTVTSETAAKKESIVAARLRREG